MDAFSSRMSDVYDCDQQILLRHLQFRAAWLVSTGTAEQEGLPFDSSSELYLEE